MARHTFDRIYIHCSYSKSGNFETINNWHKDRTFPAVLCPIRKKAIYCGYHYLVYNQYTTPSQVKNTMVQSITDGQVIIARPITSRGAHVRGENYKSLGICYIGDTPTPAQWNALVHLTARLVKTYKLSINKVLGHHEYYLNNNEPMIKTCPNFNMESFRGAIQHHLTF